MGLTNTAILKCDYVQGGKPCGKVFVMPEDPRQNTPGTENTVSIVIAKTNQRLYFCSMLHAVAFGVNWIKDEHGHAVETEQIPLNGNSEASPDIVRLQELGIIESDVPHAPEDLNLGD
jgi:hypothetical protein